jgi:ubiquinone/menaquinone biosynthesis C-methylase UbiE
MKLTVLDINASMLKVGRERATVLGIAENCKFLKNILLI